MHPDEIPVEPVRAEPAEPSEPARRGSLSGGRRLAVTAVFALGLLTVGGVATVLAASPSPSASSGSTAPSASHAPSASCPAHPAAGTSGSSS